MLADNRKELFCNSVCSFKNNIFFCFKDVPTFHTSRESSNAKIILSTVSIVTVTTAQTTTSNTSNTSSSDNGIYESNSFTLKYMDKIDSTDFVITSKTGSTSNVYFAFGLSNDQIMVIKLSISFLF